MAVHTPPPPAPARPAPAALPPGPRLGRLAQSVGFHRHPLAFLRANRRAYGDLFTINLAVAGPMVVVADLHEVERLLESDPDHAHGGEARRRILGMVSPRAILGADSADHKRARGRLEPAFTPDTIDALEAQMAPIAERHVAAWPRGRPFQALPRLRALLGEIFVRLVLGVRDERRAQALTEAIGRMLATPGNPPIPAPGPRDGLVGKAAGLLFDRRTAPIERLMGEEIESRRTEEPRHDAIGCALRYGPPQPTADLVDELIPLLMAGQEPPAAALAWLLDSLLREPQELTDEFVRETFRRTPPVHSVVRRLTKPAQISGHHLPAGTTTMVPIVLMQDVGGPDIPFGGGNRRCLGEWLAHAEIRTVLPIVLRQAALEPVWPRPERMVVRGTVLVPHRGELVRRD